MSHGSRALVCLALLLVSSAAGAQYAPVLVELGTLGCSHAQAEAVNNRGQVAGWARQCADGSPHAFFWSQRDGMLDLGATAEPGPIALNDWGQVVGPGFSWTRTGGRIELPFVAIDVNNWGQVLGSTVLWSRAGGLVDLGSLGLEPDAAAINDLGQVAGRSTASDGTSRAFLWTPRAGMADLGPGYATALNDRGRVVGCGTFGDRYHAFSWTRAEGMIDLEPGSSRISYAVAVNDSDQIVGHWWRGPWTRSFSWTPSGGLVDLGTLAGWRTLANAVSSSGQVVGASSLLDDYPMHAFSWTASSGMVDLGMGLKSYGQAVNDFGQVVGMAETFPPSDNDFYWDTSRAVLWRTDPLREIDLMVLTVGEWGMPFRLAAPLTMRLVSARLALNAGNSAKACNDLRLFVSTVGGSTALTPERASALAAPATDVRVMLQCP